MRRSCVSSFRSESIETIGDVGGRKSEQRLLDFRWVVWSRSKRERDFSQIVHLPFLLFFFKQEKEEEEVERRSREERELNNARTKEGGREKTNKRRDDESSFFPPFSASLCLLWLGDGRLETLKINSVNATSTFFSFLFLLLHIHTHTDASFTPFPARLSDPASALSEAFFPLPSSLSPSWIP